MVDVARGGHDADLGHLRASVATIDVVLAAVDVVVVLLVALERVLHRPSEVSDPCVRHGPAVEEDEPVLHAREGRG